MIHFLIRILTGIIGAIILSSVGVYISSGVSNLLFSVYSVVFSISASLMITFNTRDIRNKEVRENIVKTISEELKWASIDFLFAIIIFGLFSSYSCEDPISLTIGNFQFHPCTFSSMITLSFLFFSVVRIQKLRELFLRIENKIIDETGS